MNRRRRDEPLDPPPEIMTKAEELAAGGVEAFNAAAEALQKAVDHQNAEAEKYWRQVFDGYTIVVQRHSLTMDEWHNVHTAGMYALGDNPRGEKLTPEQQQEVDEEYRRWHEERQKHALTHTEPATDKPDDEIPF